MYSHNRLNMNRGGGRVFSLDASFGLLATASASALALFFRLCAQLFGCELYDMRDQNKTKHDCFPRSRVFNTYRHLYGEHRARDRAAAQWLCGPEPRQPANLSGAQELREAEVAAEDGRTGAARKYHVLRRAEAEVLPQLVRQRLCALRSGKGGGGRATCCGARKPRSSHSSYASVFVP